MVSIKDSIIPDPIIFEDKTRRKPKITGGGGRAGDARKDGSQPVPLDSAT